MAIICYTGVMGSGKTYEAVSTAAMNALRDGRRVVTNIAGFNFDAIQAFLGEFKDGSLLNEDRVLVVPSTRITEPFFFFDPDVQNESVVLPGDLVLIDEVWAFWGTGIKLSTEHQKFFRMHRHYTEEGTGTSCDLVIMIQDLTSLHRSIRGVLQSTFKFSKMVTLGLTSRYRVEVYEGNKQSRATLVSVSNNKYDKKIFPLYQSYDGGSGTEKSVDDRQNLFANKWFLLVFVSSIFGLIWAGSWLFSWIGEMTNGGKDVKQAASTQPQTTSSNSQSQGPFTTSSVPLSAELRLVAVVETPAGETLLTFQTPDGRFVRKRMDAGHIDGWQTVAGFEGRMVGFTFGNPKK